MGKPGKVVAIFVLLVALVLCPFYLDIIRLRLMTEVVYYSLYAVSLNMILGYGGLLSFGHSAYFGVGAYVTAIALLRIKGLGLLPAILAGGLSAAVIGSFFSIFLIRVSGTYFAMLTLAFNQLLYAVALKWRPVTGGDDGLGGFSIPDLHLPWIGKIDMLDTSNFFWFTLVVIGVMLLFAWHITRTPLGISILLLRENEERAQFLGHQTSLTRFWLLTLASFFAGISGSMFALFQEFVATSAIDVLKSIDGLLMVIIGGVGNFFGPLLGSLFYIIVGDWLSRVTEHWEFFIGCFFIVLVLFFRGGLVGLLAGAQDRLLKALVHPRGEAAP